jgi:hypothetical protein
MSNGTFADMPIIAETGNFLITAFPGDADCDARARALADTCEADLARLEDLFNTDFHVGGRNEHGVWVRVMPAPAGGGGGASNRGWEEGSDDSSVITIEGTYIPSSPAPDNGFVFASMPRMLFIAELSELLMDFTGNGWDRKASNGEALSVVLATEFYPAGYYRTGQGPRVNPWLRSAPPRPDYVSNTDDSDTDWVSFGCGILFIDYLRYQLGIPLDDIVPAGGDTLAETSERVRRKSASGAFKEFDDLIERHMPRATRGRLGRNIVKLDNIFPLYDPPARSIWLQVGDNIISRPSRPKPSDPRFRRTPPKTVLLKPGFACPEKRYAYWSENEIREVKAVAVGRGFLSAAFRWTVNGVELPTHGPQAYVAIPGDLYEWLPDGKTKKTGSGAEITYIITDDWNRSVLRVRNIDFTGNCALEIVVRATEKAKNDRPTRQASSWELVAVDLTIEDAYYQDARRCNPTFEALDRDLEALGHEIFIAKTLPDPPHDAVLTRILTAAERANNQAVKAAESLGRPKEQILRELGRRAPFATGFAFGQPRLAEEPPEAEGLPLSE